MNDKNDFEISGIGFGMYKRDIINFLFILSFPIYGIGNYLSAIKSPSVGYIISISAHLLIILFYCIDLLYRREFKIRINGVFGLMALYLASCVASLFVALDKGLPEDNLILTLSRSLLLIAPFHAFIIVVLYNDNHEDKLPKLALISFSMLLLFNLIGYFGLGLTNGVHGIDGRLNFPFLDGFYSGASLLAIIDLILLYYLYKSWRNPIQFASLAAYFLFNLVLFFLINSRLAILIFLFVLMLSFFGIIRARGVYLLSLFTLPILLSSGILIYEILKQPAFVSILQRVDVQDVVTFNGRAFLWQDAMDWLLYDQSGLLFGNGYKGHYFLDLISDVAKLWNEKDVHHMHLHSTSLEILVSQGLIFFLLFCVLLFRMYTYYRRKHLDGKEEGALLPVSIFMLFILQVDTFVYLDSLGFIIFSFLLAKTAVTEKVNVKRGIKLSELRRMKLPRLSRHDLTLPVIPN